MEIFKIAVLAVVQGISEWLPISSSGHLVIFEKILNSPAPVEFDIFLHLASLIVILFFFRKEIKQIILSIFKKSAASEGRGKWWWYIVLSSLVTALIGFGFYPYIENFRNLADTANMLFVTSILVFLTGFARGQKSINWWLALLLGLIQGLAVMPGLSRSGAVIALALLLGINKKDAFDYTFIMAIPAILGAFILVFDKVIINIYYLLGFIITIVVGYLALAILKYIVNKNRFYLFFIYTLALALIIKLI